MNLLTDEQTESFLLLLQDDYYVRCNNYIKHDTTHEWTYDRPLANSS